MRALHQQPVRRGRNEKLRVTSRDMRAGASAMLPWLGLSLLLLIADQFSKLMVLGYYRLGDSTTGHQLLQPGAGAQRRRGLFVPGRRLRLAALVLQRDRHRCGRVHPLDAQVAPGPAPVRICHVLHTGGRRRQRDRPPVHTATWSIFYSFTMPAGISPLST